MNIIIDNKASLELLIQHMNKIKSFCADVETRTILTTALDALRKRYEEWTYPTTEEMQKDTSKWSPGRT